MIFFRADGNSTIGLGHLMRCFAIADEIGNDKVCFLCADNQSGDIADSRGFKTRVLGTKPFSKEEALIVTDICKEENEKPTIVIDSYLVSKEYTSYIHEFAKIICMDDIYAEYENVDGIINYNSYADSKNYNVNNVKLLVGAEYVPLRREFQGYEELIRTNINKILISTGGSDPQNLAYKITNRLLCNDVFKEKEIHIVCGKMNPNKEELVNLASENCNVNVHVDVKNMSQLMKDCDIAVSAGGSTCYEMCAMGLPFVVFSFADNQRLLAIDMGNRGGAIYAGHIEGEPDSVLTNIAESLLKIEQEQNMLKSMSSCGHKVVDGLGAKRLKQEILSL